QPFSVCIAEVDAMEGFNDALGFERGEALLDATAQLLGAGGAPGVDLVCHVAGTRFVVLAQGADWGTRSGEAAARFRILVEREVPAAIFQRGYFVAESRAGPRVRPLPRLVVAVQ